MRILFNDDNTKKGVEGWYELIGAKLIVYIKSTNSREDWISDFIVIPWWNKGAHCFIHLGFKKYALWLEWFITDLIYKTGASSIYIFGYSMGGGIVQILSVRNFIHSLIRTVKYFSIDGPRTTSKITSNCKLYYNRGSLVSSVPFWFKRIKNRICLNKKWRVFWKAHADYNIDEIIQEVVN